MQRYVQRAEAARYLTENWFPISEQTLANLARRGGGPVFQKAGKLPVYTPKNLDSWARSKLSRPVTTNAELKEVVR
jgi:hypothetical protein